MSPTPSPSHILCFGLIILYVTAPEQTDPLKELRNKHKRFKHPTSDMFKVFKCFPHSFLISISKTQIAKYFKQITSSGRRFVKSKNNLENAKVNASSHMGFTRTHIERPSFDLQQMLGIRTHQMLEKPEAQKNPNFRIATSRRNRFSRQI